MRRIAYCLVATYVLGLSSSAMAESFAGSGDPFILNFDEHGNGTISNNGGPFVPIVGVLLADPTGRLGVPVLTYMLPSPVVNGDVRVWEDMVNGTLTDVMTFTNAAGSLDGSLNADRLIFMSDNFDGVDALADTGFPTTLTPRDAGGILEVGTEGNNHFDYAPGGSADNQYHGISDGVLAAPLPGTALAGLALIGGLGAYKLTRRKTEPQAA